MALNNAAKNLMLDDLADVILYLSAHTADPGTTGTSEVTGSPYARSAVTWGAAAAGSLAASADVVIQIPGGTTVTHIGFWSAVSGGTFYGSDAVASESFGAAGNLTVTDATIDLNA